MMQLFPRCWRYAFESGGTSPTKPWPYIWLGIMRFNQCTHVVWWTCAAIVLLTANIAHTWCNKCCFKSNCHHLNTNAGRQLGPDPWQNRHVHHKRAYVSTRASNTASRWFATEPWRFVVYTGRARGEFVHYVRDWYRCVGPRCPLSILHRVDDAPGVLFQGAMLPRFSRGNRGAWAVVI